MFSVVYVSLSVQERSLYRAWSHSSGAWTSVSMWAVGIVLECLLVLDLFCILETKLTIEKVSFAYVLL